MIMKLKTPSINYSYLLLTLITSGCAQMPEGFQSIDKKTFSAITGAAAGCASGLVVAQISGGNQVRACLIAAAAGGVIGFEHARQQELEEANAARQDILKTLAPIATQKGLRVNAIKTKELTLESTDGKEHKKISTFGALSVDLPTSAKNRPEHAAALEKLSRLAEKIADERGSAEIQLAMRPEDAKTSKAKLNTESITTAKGKQIIFVRKTDGTLPKGIERITVTGGAILTAQKAD